MLLSDFGRGTHEANGNEDLSMNADYLLIQRVLVTLEVESFRTLLAHFNGLESLIS